LFQAVEQLLILAQQLLHQELLPEVERFWRPVKAPLQLLAQPGPATLGQRLPYLRLADGDLLLPQVPVDLGNPLVRKGGAGGHDAGKSAVSTSAGWR